MEAVRFVGQSIQSVCVTCYFCFPGHRCIHSDPSMNTSFLGGPPPQLSFQVEKIYLYATETDINVEATLNFLAPFSALDLR